jgi:hypothetical protein
MATNQTAMTCQNFGHAKILVGLVWAQTKHTLESVLVQHKHMVSFCLKLFRTMKQGLPWRWSSAQIMRLATLSFLGVRMQRMNRIPQIQSACFHRMVVRAVCHFSSGTSNTGVGVLQLISLNKRNCLPFSSLMESSSQALQKSC